MLTKKSASVVMPGRFYIFIIKKTSSFIFQRVHKTTSVVMFFPPGGIKGGALLQLTLVAKIAVLESEEI